MSSMPIDLQRRRFCLQAGTLVSAAGIVTFVPVSAQVLSMPAFVPLDVTHHGLDPVFDYGPYYAEAIGFSQAQHFVDIGPLHSDPQLILT